MAITKVWNEPKVAIWYYKGSDDNYHYFKYADLGINKEYRVVISELELNESYPVRENYKEWWVMPWGPHAIK